MKIRSAFPGREHLVADFNGLEKLHEIHWVHVTNDHIRFEIHDGTVISRVGCGFWKVGTLEKE